MPQRDCMTADEFVEHMRRVVYALGSAEKFCEEFRLHANMVGYIQSVLAGGSAPSQALAKKLGYERRMMFVCLAEKVTPHADA